MKSAPSRARRSSPWRRTSPANKAHRGARRLPGRHPRHQRRRPAAGDFPQFLARRLEKALAREHDHSIELIKATVMEDGEALRAHPQHHLDAVKAPTRSWRCRTARGAASPAFVAGLARKPSHNVTITTASRALLDRPADQQHRVCGEEQGKTPEEIKRDGKGDPAGASARPREFGELCAYLCSVQAGYITGQNFRSTAASIPDVLAVILSEVSAERSEDLLLVTC